MAQPAIQTSFASGEWAPKLRSRVDIQKYHSGAELLRNFYVDYSGGGASTRQGTKYVNTAGNSAHPVRLVGFQPSTSVSYVLEFGDHYLRFHTNGATVLSGGVPYQISTPFAAGDLFPNPVTGNPGIKFVQDVTSLIICHPNYQPQILTIISATNWTISTINFGPTIPTPTGLTLTSTDSAGVIWYSAYLVTAVDGNGQESAPPTPATFAGTNPLTLSTGVSFTLTWTAVSGAASYNVYKASQSYKSPIPAGAQYGFIGNVTGVSFIDSTPGIGADFSQTPPVTENPFQGSGVQSATITNAGTYTTVPTATVAAPPAGGAQATLQVVVGVTAVGTIAFGGTGFVVGQSYAVVQGANTNPTIFVITVLTIDGFGGIISLAIAWPGALTSGNVPTGNFTVVNPAASTVNATLQNLTWGVVSVGVISPGSGYTVVPAITFSAGAAAATAVLASASGGNPGVPGFIQQRLALGGLSQAPQSFDFSQPGSFFNFNGSNPIQADDAISANIISENLNDIRSFLYCPTGLLAFTGRTSWLISSGGGLSIQNPITPSNVSAQVQSFSGANDMPPLKINYDALYVTNKGNYVRDLNYNIYVGIFTGSDVSVLANHLFFNHYLIDWAWSEEPFKTVWATRDDGILLSLGYVKEQELIGWAHHDTNGQFKSVCTVYETVNGNVVDAVYLVVQRQLPSGAFIQYIERMADRFFPYGYEDSWSVDCALQTVPQVTQPLPGLNIRDPAGAVGNIVRLMDTTFNPFTVGMVGWVVRASGGIFTITSFTDSGDVTATVTRVPTTINAYTGLVPLTGYTIWKPVTTVSGLTQLVGQTVTGVADGAVVPPSIVSAGGSVTLGTAATKITLGLAYTPQMKTLRLDLGQPTVQSKRKKLPAATLRVADTLGLQMGTSFANAVSLKDLVIGNLNIADNVVVSDLYSGDAFVILDQLWQEPGQLVIQQNLPYPATILGVMPQVTVGDTPNVRAG